MENLLSVPYHTLQFFQKRHCLKDVGSHIKGSGAGANESSGDDSSRWRCHVVLGAGNERRLEKRHRRLEGGLLQRRLISRDAEAIQRLVPTLESHIVRDEREMTRIDGNAVDGEHVVDFPNQDASVVVNNERLEK